MRKLIIAITTILYALSIQAQPDLIPYRKGDQWGYCDKDKKILIQPRFEEVNFFTSIYGNMAAKVKRDGKYGLISEAGKELLPFKYNEVVSLAPGLVKVKIGDKWRLMHNKHRVKSSKYDDIQLIGSQYLVVKKNKKAGITDLNGKRLISPKFDSFETTRLVKYLLARKNGKVGLVNLQRKKVMIPAIYDRIGVITDNKYIVKHGNKYGLANAKHKLKLPVVYDRITPEGECYIVEQKKRQGLVDAKGKKILDVKFDKLFAIEKGKFQVELDGKRASFNEKNRQLSPFTTIDPASEVVDDIEVNLDVELMSTDSENVMKPYKQNGKWGFAVNWVIVIDCKYDKVKDFDYYNKLAEVIYKGRKGYINRKGVEYFED